MQAGRQVGRQADRQASRQAGRQAGKQAGRLTDRQTLGDSICRRLIIGYNMIDATYFYPATIFLGSRRRHNSMMASSLQSNRRDLDEKKSIESKRETALGILISFREELEMETF